MAGKLGPTVELALEMRAHVLWRSALDLVADGAQPFRGLRMPQGRGDRGAEPIEDG